MTSDTKSIPAPDSDANDARSLPRLVAHWVLSSIGVGLAIVVAIVVTINVAF